jgi:hypothetical protein
MNYEQRAKNLRDGRGWYPGRSDLYHWDEDGSPEMIAYSSDGKQERRFKRKTHHAALKAAVLFCEQANNDKCLDRASANLLSHAACGARTVTTEATHAR